MGTRSSRSCDRLSRDERLALHVLHHEEELPLRRHDVERRDDVGVADARGEARLVEEHRDELGILRVLRVQPLDRDRPREPDRSQKRPKCTVAMPPDAIAS